MAFVLKCERPWKTPLVLYFYPRLCTVSETAKVVPAIGEGVTPRSTISVPRTEYVLLTPCIYHYERDSRNTTASCYKETPRFNPYFNPTQSRSRQHRVTGNEHLATSPKSPKLKTFNSPQTTRKPEMSDEQDGSVASDQDHVDDQLNDEDAGGLFGSGSEDEQSGYEAMLLNDELKLISLSSIARVLGSNVANLMMPI